MRALMVDDDELSLELLEGILNELGYEVDRESNGREALEKLAMTAFISSSPTGKCRR